MTHREKQNVIIARELHDPIERLLSLCENVEFVRRDERMFRLIAVVLKSKTFSREDFKHGGVHGFGGTLCEKVMNGVCKARSLRKERKLSDLGKKRKL